MATSICSPRLATARSRAAQLRRFFRLARHASVCVLVLAPVAPAGAATDGDKALIDVAADFTTEYLSDRRRAGSLVGGILGGALTAHPAGPFIGSLLGFWIGKATMHEKEDKEGVSAVTWVDPRRPIVPESGVSSVAAMSFDGGTVSFDTSFSGADVGVAVRAEPAILAAPALDMMPGAAPASPFAPLAGRLPEPPSRAQLAMLCAGASADPPDPRLRNACFYFSGY